MTRLHIFIAGVLFLCALSAAGADEFSAGQVSPPLTLPQAVAASLAASPAARAAEQSLAQAQARLSQSQAMRRFQITFNSAVSVSNASVIQPPPGQETFGTLQNTLTLPLALGRKPALAVQQSTDLLLSAQAQYASARLALAGQVAGAYYDLLRKTALLSVAQETFAQAGRELVSAQKRNRAGDVAALDVLQAQVPVALAQSNVNRAQNDMAVARETLNDLIGRPLDSPLTLADVYAPAGRMPFTLEEARALALARSADVRAAEANARAGASAVALSRLFREPAYSLQFIDTRSNDQTSFSRDDTLQAQVSLPLSDGGLGAAQTREAAAFLAQSQAQAATARRAVLVAVSTAYITALSSRTQVVSAQAARGIAQTTYDKTVQGYENGLFPLINVLNAQNALAQARIAAIQAVYDAASAQTALDAAVNGGMGQMSGAPGALSAGGKTASPIAAGSAAP